MYQPGREDHVLRRLNVTSHPRIAALPPIPPALQLVTQDFDYPRICTTNAQASNAIYHQEALRSTLADVILRSSQAKEGIPANVLDFANRWATGKNIDSSNDILLTTERQAYFGNSVMLIPIFRHRPANSQESLVLLMLVTIQGVYLVNPVEHRAARALKYILEDANITKILLNAPSELHFYWVLLKAAVKNVFCMRGHMVATVEHKDDSWSTYCTSKDPLPKFNQYYQLPQWEPIVMDCGQDEIGNSGLHRPVKSEQLLTYANTCVLLLDAMKNDVEDLQSHVNWSRCIRQLLPYVNVPGFINMECWTIISRGLEENRNMYVYAYAVVNLAFRRHHGVIGAVTTEECSALYDKIVSGQGPSRPIKYLTNKLCSESAETESAFIQCMNLTAVERRIRIGFCTKPGCFSDITCRFNRIAPHFLIESLAE